VGDDGVEIGFGVELGFGCPEAVEFFLICKTLNLTLQLGRSCQELSDTVPAFRSSLRAPDKDMVRTFGGSAVDPFSET
jgi:hypothetical protein